jgi:hypothetical protein
MGFLIRFGVHRIDHFRGAGGERIAWLRRGHFDYRLLRTGIPPSTLELEFFEKVMREMQFSSGVFRTTSPGRFRDLDEWVMPVLARHFPADLALDVRDWAASDCSTSAAWHGKLKAAFPNAALTASDLNGYLIEMAVDGGGSYIFDAGWGLLQYVRPPFVLRIMPPEPRRLALNWLLARRAKTRLDRLWRERAIHPEMVRFAPGNEEMRYRDVTFRQIPLFHPFAAALAKGTPSFRISEHSVFERAEKPAHVIRTMNIFNRSYFEPAMLERGARSVWESLQPEGLWIVGRTIQPEPAIHHVSILVKASDRFHLVDRHVEKSEVEDLALALRM